MNWDGYILDNGAWGVDCGENDKRRRCGFCPIFAHHPVHESERTVIEEIMEYDKVKIDVIQGLNFVSIVHFSTFLGNQVSKKGKKVDLLVPLCHFERMDLIFIQDRGNIDAKNFVNVFLLREPYGWTY